MGITAIEIAQKHPPYAAYSTFEVMREIVFGDPVSCVKHPEEFDPSFIAFVKSCLVKDPKMRPNAEEVLQRNEKFFSLARDKNYIRENLLKNVPTVQERVSNNII